MISLVEITKGYKEFGPDWNKKIIQKYRFDYLEDAVKEWKCEHITKSMLESLPFGILFYEGKDFYGEEIEDINFWYNQRKKYIEEYLYPKYKR